MQVPCSTASRTKEVFAVLVQIAMVKIFLLSSHPDLTYVVDWALKANYLSLLLSICCIASQATFSSRSRRNNQLEPEVRPADTLNRSQARIRSAEERGQGRKIGVVSLSILSLAGSYG